jgi:ribosome-binding factor A
VRGAVRAFAHASWGALALVLRRAFAPAIRATARQPGDVSQRTERVDELLRQEIGAIITRDIADPRVGFATITSVETTPDLRHAKVWVSVIGQPAERDATMAALRHAVPFIRHELGRVLRIKRIPDLHLHLDDTAERGTRILHLLSELESGMMPDASVPSAESLPTPIARLPHDGDLGDEPPSAAIPPEPQPRRRPGARRTPAHRRAHR